MDERQQCRQTEQESKYCECRTFFVCRRWSVYMICGMIFQMRIFRSINDMTQEEDYV